MESIHTGVGVCLLSISARLQMLGKNEDRWAAACLPADSWQPPVASRARGGMLVFTHKQNGVCAFHKGLLRKEGGERNLGQKTPPTSIPNKLCIKV